jgi:multidrug efflux system membrane fusion protein
MLFVLSVVSQNREIIGTRVTLEPCQQAILSSEVTSKIVMLKVREGESIKKGDKLVVMSTSSLKLSQQRERINMEKVKLNLEFTKLEFEKNKSLYKRNILINKERRLDENKIANLEYDLANQKAVLKLLSIEILKSVICAPFDGKVLTKLIKEHEYVTLGAKVLVVIDDTALHAVFYMRNVRVKDFSKSKFIKMRFPHSDIIYNAEIISFSANIDPGSGTILVKAVIDNKEGNLKMGMIGQICE